MTYDLGRRLRPFRFERVICGCLFAFAVIGCGESVAPSSPLAATGALTTSERTHTARAGVYAANVARYRAAAAAQRQQAAAYARWAPKPGAALTTNWNEQLKATHESRAAAAEQIASEIQTIVDFHTAEANKEVGR